jgi:5-(carboxyamino)imidazole ribonucleotide synthase
MTNADNDTLIMQKPICIGIIGGGQLGKMIAQEAKRMSLRVIILDPSTNCPASVVSDEQIVADFKDESAIRELANKSDVLTYKRTLHLLRYSFYIKSLRRLIRRTR